MGARRVEPRVAASVRSRLQPGEPDQRSRMGRRRTRLRRAVRALVGGVAARPGAEARSTRARTPTSVSRSVKISSATMWAEPRIRSTIRSSMCSSPVPDPDRSERCCRCRATRRIGATPTRSCQRTGGCRGSPSAAPARRATATITRRCGRAPSSRRSRRPSQARRRIGGRRPSHGGACRAISTDRRDPPPILLDLTAA